MQLRSRKSVEHSFLKKPRHHEKYCDPFRETSAQYLAVETLNEAANVYLNDSN